MSKSGKKEGPRAPTPKDSVLVVGPNGKKELEAPDITPESVGWKGFGLAVIPRKWSLPFFVIDAECAGDSQHLSPESLQIYAGLAGLNIEGPLLIRSSGTHETLTERGRLESAQCNKNRIRETIEQLRKQIPSQYTGRIHWIVQEHRRPRSKGISLTNAAYRTRNAIGCLRLSPAMVTPANDCILDYYIFPRIDVLFSRLLSEKNELSVDVYRFDDLNFFTGMASRAQIEAA